MAYKGMNIPISNRLSVSFSFLLAYDVYFLR